MDLIPRPDQVVAAAANVAHRLVYGGLADLRPMPRTQVDEGPRLELHHYRSRPSHAEDGDPVLLVSPLAAPASCYDLRRGCSLVERLVEAGRPTYQVEYGDLLVRDDGTPLDIADLVDEVLPRAVRTVSRHAGDRPVHLVGWGSGGLLALLTAADRSDLPLASLATLALPVDVGRVPDLAPFPPWLGIAGERAGLVSHAHRLLGGLAVPGVARAFQVPAVNRFLTRPIAVAAKLDDADFLAQVHAVDRFTAGTAAHPGRTFGRLYHRLPSVDLDTGRVALRTGEVDVSALRTPLLAVAGATDGIAPVDSVRPLVDLVPAVDDLRFEVVPGGHLGMLTGRAARRTTWPVLEEWLVANASSVGGGRTRRPPRRSPAPRSPAAARRTASTQAIGANPHRRYGSAPSRALAAR